jgi:hypothetical protein
MTAPDQLPASLALAANRVKQNVLMRLRLTRRIGRCQASRLEACALCYIHPVATYPKAGTCRCTFVSIDAQSEIAAKHAEGRSGENRWRQRIVH